jgi:hypothetical protein
MSLCDIFPDDPSCAVAEPEPVPEPEPAVTEVTEGGEEGGEETGEGAGEGDAEAEEKGEEISDVEKRVFDSVLEVAKWEHIKQLREYAALSPFNTNLTLLMTAAGMAGTYANYALRYRSKSDYYDGAKIGTDTNWWKTSDMIRLWGGLAVFGTLTVTQTLSTFGIATGLNLSLWMWLGWIGFSLVQGIVAILRFLGLEASNTERKKTGSASMASSIKLDSIEDMLMDSAVMFTMFETQDQWFFIFWNSITSD